MPRLACSPQLRMASRPSLQPRRQPRASPPHLQAWPVCFSFASAHEQTGGPRSTARSTVHSKPGVTHTRAPPTTPAQASCHAWLPHASSMPRFDAEDFAAPLYYTEHAQDSHFYRHMPGWALDALQERPVAFENHNFGVPRPLQSWSLTCHALQRAVARYSPRFQVLTCQTGPWQCCMSGLWPSRSTTSLAVACLVHVAGVLALHISFGLAPDCNFRVLSCGLHASQRGSHAHV